MRTCTLRSRFFSRLVVLSSLLWTASAATSLTALPEMTAPPFLHDPSQILQEAGRYWVFATGNGVQSHFSDDLETWSRGPQVFRTLPEWHKEVVPAHRGHLWAPDIIKVNDRYLLFYSVSSWGQNRSAIGLATSPTLNPEHPDYAWTDRGIVVQSAPEADFNAIDPAAFLDDDGRLWLTFGSFWSGIQLIELHPESGLPIAPDPPLHNLADHESIEAPFLAKHNGFYYLFVNWGACCRGVDSTYEIRVGRSPNITGPYLDQDGKDMLTGGGTLLLGRQGDFIGPGHAALLQAADDTFLICHFYDGARRGRATLAIRPFHWSAAGWPSVDPDLPPRPWSTYQGPSGRPGSGKTIVFVTGDEEYRSEEAMPALAQILAEHHGFTCHVLFSVNPDTGIRDPNAQTNIPGLHLLESADLMVLFTRFRQLPDDQMARIDHYLQSGKPIFGIRTATHAFAFPAESTSRFKHYSWNHQSWPGGFGRQVLGETWVDHHGVHGKESTRGIPNAAMADHPILRGVGPIWCPTDVYAVRDPSPDVLVFGQVLSGMQPSDPPLAGSKNEPMMPVAWLRQYQPPSGMKTQVFCSTMGAAVDLKDENLRRLMVNAVYWLTDLSDAIPDKSNVDFVEPYNPSWFGFRE